MQSLYWRSNRVSTPQLVVVAALAAMGLVFLELNPSQERDAQYETKLEAARLADRAFRAIYVERISRQIPLEPEFDPAGSGLIGPPHSSIVSNEGHLGAKQTTANPNWAAVFVQMLSEAGAEEGDLVAANMTGSFPAMNIAMYAAFEVLGLEPIVVSSVAASEYGATHPELTWVDMERVLFERRLVSFRSRAVSMGGVLDVARNHSEEGRAAIQRAIERSGRPLMSPSSFDEAVQMRMDLYDQVRGDRPIAAFVNVGGGTASVGTSVDKRDFLPGLNTDLPSGLERPSVMRSFLERDVPVIHVSHVRDIARRYGLPETPVEVPAPGEGGVFTQTVVQTWAVLLVLGLILLAMYLATRFDLATTFSRGADKEEPPEQMV
ncbi:MAG TPA: poly-gamma-glutamate system protein [Sandaracinaceae bacterium LLY-WYZ-13_1]|nr:poly-gamma-glutamate system protein [Sandaracinaceae bacterium LLY-WYZ-13_1]